jgi:hypothetical protein
MLRISDISGIGSFLTADLTEVDIKLHKYIIITFLKDKEADDKSHKLKFFQELYDTLPSYSAKMPYEEFYDILK